MRVTRYGSASGGAAALTSGAGAAAAAAGSGGGFGSLLAPAGGRSGAATAGVAGIAAPAALAAALSMLALQEAPDPGQRRRRAARRGHDLLAALERLHRDLLLGGEGEFTPEGVTALAGELRRSREGSGEPELDAILDGIELRCAVELAKLDVATVGEEGASAGRTAGTGATGAARTNAPPPGA